MYTKIRWVIVMFKKLLLYHLNFLITSFFWPLLILILPILNQTWVISTLVCLNFISIFYFFYSYHLYTQYSKFPSYESAHTYFKKLKKVNRSKHRVLLAERKKMEKIKKIEQQKKFLNEKELEIESFSRKHL